MEYIINLLKECIVTSFLFGVLWMLTPRFLKSSIKGTFKTTKVVAKFIGIQSIKIGKKGVIAYKELYVEKKEFKKKNLSTNTNTKVNDKVVGENFNSNLIQFPINKKK